MNSEAWNIARSVNKCEQFFVDDWMVASLDYSSLKNINKVGKITVNGEPHFAGICFQRDASERVKCQSRTKFSEEFGYFLKCNLQCSTEK